MFGHNRYQKIFPGGEAESELANGMTVNATVSGHYFTSFPLPQQCRTLRALVQWDIAHRVCIVKRNVRVSLYLQHCIHFFLLLMLRDIIQKNVFRPSFKRNLNVTQTRDVTCGIS